MSEELERAANDLKNHEDHKNAAEWQKLSEIKKAIDNTYGKQMAELRKSALNADSEEEKRIIKYRMQQVAKDALEFRDRCMDGEITDPVRFKAYEPYGEIVQNELLSLSKFEGDEYDYKYLPDASVPTIEGHKNTDEEKDFFPETFDRWYSDLAQKLISSGLYQNAEPEKRADLLEGVRENAYAYAKNEWADKLDLSYKSNGEYGREMMDAGVDSVKVTQLMDDVQKLKPIGSAEKVSNLQKLQVIARAKYLNTKEKDAAIRAYASDDAQKKYDRWSKAGASPDVYVGIMTEINNLKPVGGNKSVTDNQMVNVIANYRGISDKQRWELMRAYYTSESDSDTNRKAREKFTAAQNAGFDASTYMYCRLALNDAKGHDLDGNNKTDTYSVRNAKAALIRGFNISDDLKNFLWSMDYPKQKAYSWQSDVKEGKG